MSSLADQGQEKTTAETWCILHQGNTSAVDHGISMGCNIPKPGAAAITFKDLAFLYLAVSTQEKCQKSLDKALTEQVAEEKVGMAM